MTRDEQKVFIAGLMDSVKRSMFQGIERGAVPEDWDGHELRQWLADRFEQSADMSSQMKNKRGGRRKEYERVIIVNNL